MGEGAAHKDHSRAGKIARPGRVVRVTATAAANGYQQQPATTHNARTIRANLAYARPLISGRSRINQRLGATLGATGMNNLRIFRTRMDNER